MAAVDFTISVPVERATAALAVIREAAQAQAVRREKPARLRERLAAIGELAGRVLAEAEAREDGLADRPPAGEGWKRGAK